LAYLAFDYNANSACSASLQLRSAYGSIWGNVAQISAAFRLLQDIEDYNKLEA
jgi:hypothetical protein